MFVKIRIFLFIILLAIPNMVSANLCEHAINKVAAQNTVPKDVLTAVALTETGTMKSGKMSPYPWAVNIDGKGYFFKDKQKAIATVEKFLAQGKTSIDIGCMQMNWRWHGHKFGHSVAKAFDPMANIAVGANYIRQHYKTLNSWTKAVGRYHSGTQKYAARYIKNFKRNLKALNKNSKILKDYDPIVTASVNKKKHKKKPQYNSQKPKKQSASIVASVSSKKVLDKNSVYQLALLNQAPGAIIEFNEYKEDIGNKNWNLPAAPRPILDTARKRHLFQK